ncbi:RND family efflux transporter MFP subunit [Pacificibacter maritimus]|uniref:RND family efflux transporter MFP subunit n=1 Tax=Pacificibacter maritimus TaxID=762213 RepID=A0A3N4U7W8_9RHOB|nr:efflux RND transporter periplasmic adaptor subunit [Pacificibacter maritimus]RPE66532.1 RND family efflux transporter MFP subunit [Pacificibacter maritimus]
MRQHLMTALLACICALPTTGNAQSPNVKLETVVSNSAEVPRVFFGRVVARETVDLAFQVGGQIVEYPVEEGTAVKAGQLVAQLDQEPFELALEQATAQKVQADRTAQRYRELAGSSVTETTLQDSETDAELAGIALRTAQRNLEQTTLHAPFDGIVAARIVSNYSTVAAGTSVVRLHDMSDLRIEIDVPETLVQSVRPGQSLNVTAQFPSIDKAFPLELREFNAETEQTGQTYSITLGMTPPEGLNILPGASAKVTVYFSTGEEGIIVPASAIITENDGSTSVMVFDPTGANEGTVTTTPVEITPTDTGKVRILSGLSDGQEIVIIGANALSDGDTVRRFISFEE